MKMVNENFYNLRHLKTFKNMTGNVNAGIWMIKWNSNDEIRIEKQGKLVCTIPNHDIQLATYICDLHNMNEWMVEEVESKYA